MKSKTIILSNEKSKGRGILTIFQEDDLLQCRLRLYNTPTISRYCKLGIYHEKQVTSANLLEKNGCYTSSMVGNFDIDKDFYTAIIDTQNDNTVILSGGTYAGFYFNDDAVFENENKVFKHIEKENPNTNIYTYPNEQKTEDFNHEKCDEDCEKCKNCKYKEYFYSHQTDEIYENIEEDASKQISTQGIPTNQTIQTSNNESFKEQNTTEQKSIIASLIPQFKYVFENYETDETLTKLIPNSKFVKINENQEQFSIGAIYDNDEMKYICYATMCNYNTPAPQELGAHYQWLPLDKDDPLSEGYYIVFQDAQDLKIVEL